MKLKKIYTVILLITLSIVLSPTVMAQGMEGYPSSTKKERNHITKGNKLYNEGKYVEALKEYQAAQQENPSSVVALYDAGLSMIRIGSNPNDTTKAAKDKLEAGLQAMQIVAGLDEKRPDLASMANYNLGNAAFNSEQYREAVNYYKKALRLNPTDENARRNLRIAQLKIKDDNQDQQQQQQEQQEQEQDQQEQEQNQDQNQDQNEEQQDQQEQNQQEQQSNLNEQTAEQILNAMENKENQTRARVAGQNAEKSRQRNRNRKNW